MTVRAPRRATKAPKPPRKPAGGRPSLLTPETAENILRAIRAGSHIKHACESYGVSYATAARWMADGQAHAEGRATTAQRENLGASADAAAERACVGMDELQPSGEVRRTCPSDLHRYREFREAVVRARAEAVVSVVGRLQEAARSGSVTAQLALLRALAPEEWGETRKVTLEGGAQGAGTGPPLIIELYASDRDPKELAEIMATLEEDVTK